LFVKHNQSTRCDQPTSLCNQAQRRGERSDPRREVEGPLSAGLHSATMKAFWACRRSWVPS